MQHPPPCCASCPELASQPRACRLLAQPTVENRLRMLTMPCDVRRLVRLRMRAHGDDVVAEALARWEAVDTTPESLVQHDGGPLDARLWLSPWPLSALAGRVVEQRAGQGGLTSGAGARIGEALPDNRAPIYASLLALQRIDPAGFALIVDRLRGSFDAVLWRASFGDNDQALANRLALALYKLFALRAGVLERMHDQRARACLVARRFQPGDGSEFASLTSARHALGDPTLTLTALRAHEQRGAHASIELLRSDPTVRVVLSPAALSAFRRALRIDTDADADADAYDPHYDQAFLALLDRELRADAPRTPEGHFAVSAIARFAASEGLGGSESDGLALVEHLVACSDERCNHVFRGEVSGREMVRRALGGPMSEPPPSFPGAVAAGHLVTGPASPRMIRCRDVLWETFTSMALDEGRDVDDLVEEAMDRYRSLRAHVREAAGLPSSVITAVDPARAHADNGDRAVTEERPAVEGRASSPPESPATRRSSAPPPSGRSGTRGGGLRLGGRSWPPRPPSSPDADAPRLPEPSDEATLPGGLEDVTKRR